MDVPAPFAGTVGELHVEGRRQGLAGDAAADASSAGRGEAPAARRRPRSPPRARRARRRRLTRCAEPRPRREAPTPPQHRLPAAPATDGHRRADLRQPGGAPARPRARHRPLARCTGTGRKGRITKDDVEAFVATGPAPAPPAPARGRRPRAAAVAVGRLREVRPGRARAALADPADLGAEPGPQLGDDPARHPQRRGRHHRARGVAQAAQRRARARRGQGDDGRVPGRRVASRR